MIAASLAGASIRTVARFFLLALLAMPARAAPQHAAPVGVTLGAYINDIAELDLLTFKYRVDFYLWILWQPRDGFDPTRLEMVNAAEVTREPGESWKLPDGREYRVYRVRGNFRGKFDFR